MSEQDIYHQLRMPFATRFINWKINNYTRDKMRALITFYLDARAVQHRLNQVLGVRGWSFTFTELERDQGVHGSLTIYLFSQDITKAKIPDECILHEVVKEDVGYASSTDKEEWYKDAVSDALKRCAVHVGIGHSLYALPHLWIDLTEPEQRYLNDEQNKYIAEWLTEHLQRMKGQE